MQHKTNLFALVMLLITQNIFAGQQFSATASQNEILCTSSANDVKRNYISRYEKDSDKGNFDYSLDELKVYFEDVYENSPRLKSRIYFDPTQKKSVSQGAENLLTVPDKFIKNILSHLEKALAARYGQYLFFPDMGHAHIFITYRDHEFIQTLEVDQQLDYIINNPNTLFLYHTAEYLHFGELFDLDSHKLNNPLYFRYLNRNVIGDNKNGDIQIIVESNKLDPYNTVRAIEGYKQWEPGLIRVLAHHAGCFKINSGLNEIRLDLKIY